MEQRENKVAHTMKFKPSLMGKVKDRAQQEGRSMTNMVEWMMSEYLKQGESNGKNKNN